MIGVCVPKDGSVTPQMILATGARWVRFTADQRFRQAEYARDCHRAGLKVFVTLDSDSLVGFDSIDQMAAYYANTFTGWIDALGIGNEPDGTGPESSREGYDTLHAKARALRREFGNTAVLVGPGLVSGDPGWLDGFDLSLVDAIDVHLYGKRPPGWDPNDMGTGHLVFEGINRYRAKLYALGYPDMPMYQSEIGLNGDEDYQARYLQATMGFLNECTDPVMSCWFAYHDHDGFGLVRADGSPKPAYDAFRRAARWVAPLEDRCEAYRQGILRTAMYVKTTPKKNLSRPKLLELLGVA